MNNPFEIIDVRLSKIENLLLSLQLQIHNKEPPPLPQEYLTRAQVSRLLSISLVSLGKYVKNGSIPAKRLNNRVLFLRTEVEASLKTIKSIKNYKGNY